MTPPLEAYNFRGEPISMPRAFTLRGVAELLRRQTSGSGMRCWTTGDAWSIPATISYLLAQPSGGWKRI